MSIYRNGVRLTGVGDYTLLENKPSINGVELVGAVTLTTGGIVSVIDMPVAASVDSSLIYHLTMYDSVQDIQPGYYCWDATSSTWQRLDNVAGAGAVINDDRKITTATWSSSKIDTEINQAIANASKTFIQDTVPTAADDVGLYYVGPDADGVYNIYLVASDASVTYIGTSEISLDDYYTKTEIDNKLGDIDRILAILTVGAGVTP